VVSETSIKTTGTDQLEPFDEFFRREYRPVLAIAFALTGRRAEAEELTMETFEAALRHWDSATMSQPGAWVRRVVSNKAVSRFRRTAVEARALARLANDRSQGGFELADEESMDLWNAVRRLPARQAQVVVLFYVGGCSRSEVAELLDIKDETVKTHLERGWERLRKELETGR